MKKRILMYLTCTTLIFNICPLTCQAEEDYASLYPSYIEEYDELYFLENPYMENLYYQYYYNMNLEFERMDLTNNEFAQTLRSEIESAYSTQQSGQLTVTLKHTTDCSFRKYVDIIFNTYIEFIKFYQYQDSTIQPDFSSCYFHPYVYDSNMTANEYHTNIVINYISYE